MNEKVLTEENKKHYLYQDKCAEAIVSVYPEVKCAPDELNIDIAPARLPVDNCYSVKSSEGSLYFWKGTSSRHFAEISITITAAVKAAYRAMKRFVRHVVHKIRISLTLRRTVFLRL